MGKWDKYIATEDAPVSDKWSKYEAAPADRSKFETPEIKGGENGKVTGQDIIEHPFKSTVKGTFQGLPETLTGKTMEERAVENVNSPEFMQSETAPFDRNIPRARLAAENRIIGGKVADMASAPINYIGGPILKGLGKAVELTGVVQKLGKPLVAKTMSFFSGIPEKDALKAINNPDILSTGWLQKEGQEVGNLYKTKITPALENLNNRVDTKGLASKLAEEIKLSNSGEMTRAATTMTGSEKAKMIKWLDEIKTGDISLNKADAMIGEIDKGLGKVYRKGEKNILQPVTTTFEALSSKLRGGLGEIRNSQYQDLAPIWNRYSDYKNAQRINQSYSSWYPKLSSFLQSASVLGPIGLGTGNPIVGSAMMATSPKAQSLVMQGLSGVSKVGSGVGKIPFLPTEAIREQVNQ